MRRINVQMTDRPRGWATRCGAGVQMSLLLTPFALDIQRAALGLHGHPVWSELVRRRTPFRFDAKFDCYRVASTGAW